MEIHGNPRETDGVPMNGFLQDTILNDDDGKHQCQVHRPADTSNILSQMDLDTPRHMGGIHFHVVSRYYRQL